MKLLVEKKGQRKDEIKPSLIVVEIKGVGGGVGGVGGVG